MSGERLLLTGIGGSIGCHTMAHIFQNTDWHIVGIDSFRHKGWTDRIETILATHPDWRRRLTLITHDLTAPITTLMAKRIGPIDFIINMASLSDVQESIDNPGPFIFNNVLLVTNMLDYARTLPLQQLSLLEDFDPENLSPQTDPSHWLRAFIQISTDEVYGPSGETDGHPEWSPILPSNPYAASKAAQEAIAISYWRSYGLPIVITNTMNNFGEMQQPKKFPAMVQSRLESGQKVTIHGNEKTIGSRYYLHSRNHADALLWILRNTQPHIHKDGEIDRPDRYNIVGDRRVNNLDLAKLIADLMGNALAYELVDFHAVRPGHDRHYGLDGSKLAKLGWKSPEGFEESLAKTIKWSHEHPEWLSGHFD